MFAPHARVSNRDLDRVQAGEDTVVDGLPPLTRTPAPSARADHVAREAVALLSSALALHAAGRLPDAISIAERANHLLADTVRAAEGFLADLRNTVNGLQPATRL